MEHRRVVLCRDAEDALALLRRAPCDRVWTTSQKSVQRQLVVAAGDLSRRIPKLPEVLRERTGVSRAHRSVPPTASCSSEPELAFAVQWALAQMWIGWGLKPSVFVGTGVGESVAACLSGTMTLDEGLRRVAGWPRVEEPVAAPLRAEGHVLLNLADLPGPGDPLDALGWAMRTLGKLWQSDVPIDWESFHGHEKRRRIPLPTYPFERQRYWVDPIPRQTTERMQRYWIHPIALAFERIGRQRNPPPLLVTVEAFPNQ